MRVTVIEASRKRCVQGRTMACTGPACMAWRWARPPHQGWVRAPEPSSDVEPTPRPANVPAGWVWVADGAEDGSGWSEPEAEWFARWRGSCGLAGPIVSDGPEAE